MSLHQIARTTLALGSLLSITSVGWMATAQPLTRLAWVVTGGLLTSGATLLAMGFQLRRKAKKERQVGQVSFDFTGNKEA
jgi:hypothetical protein